MSPSRIPRPGGLPPSPLGPGREKVAGSKPNPTKSLVASEASPFLVSANTHSRLPHPVSSPRSPRVATGTSSSPSSLPVPKTKRRPKPPSDEDLPTPRRQVSAPPPQSPKRRPVPRISSDEETGIPRLGSGPRKVLRQPASAANLSAGIPGTIPRPVGRNRAKSAAASTDRPISAAAPSPVVPSRSSSDQSGNNGAVPRMKSYLFESSFLDSREPSVPPHIASRLKLIHQLGIVLGVDEKVLQGTIDVPGLLARVDGAYEKGFGAYHPSDDGISLGRRGSNASATGLPMPMSGNPSSSSNHGRMSTDLDIGKTSTDSQHGEVPISGQARKRFAMWKRFSKNRSASAEIPREVVVGTTTVNDDGPVFGAALTDSPNGSWCTSLIGEKRHDLPLVVFTVVEEVYRRGMSQPGIFRLAGDGSRLSQLIDTYNSSPLYGDTLGLDTEPIHNLTGLIKRYVRDLPEPILDEAIFAALMTFCATEALSSSPSTEQPDTPTASPFAKETRIIAAQILLQLLPPPHFSLLMYLLAFLGQLPLFPDNRLNIDSISIIFGPAICAPRGKGISGLGPSPVGRGSDASEAERISALVDDSQVVLGWLLRNWPSISEGVLEGPRDSVQQSSIGPMEVASYDPRLLSPIDLRGQTSEDSPYARERAGPREVNPVLSPSAPSNHTVIATPPHRWSSMGVLSPPSPRVISSDQTLNRPRSATSASTTPSFGLGLFHRAKSSSNLSIAHRVSMLEPNSTPMLASGNKPKRSASFTSLSSLLKMGGNKSGSGGSLGQGQVRARPEGRPPTPLTSPQVHSVLDSLHDLLISKDKQIERDARELALLRHTLLEMDEKLQRLSTSPGGGGSYLSALHGPTSSPMSPHSSGGSQPSAYSRCSSTPSILVTSSTSSHQLTSSADVDAPPTMTEPDRDRQLVQLQDRLQSTMALLETAQVQNRDSQGRMHELESRLALSEAERRAEIGRADVQLTIEQTRVRSLIKERDMARERLDKVKTTLFAVV